MVRVCFVPITVTIYAAQYHQWNLLEAMGRMQTICYVCNLLQFSFQLYWFVQLVRLAGQVVRGWSRVDATSVSPRTTTNEVKTERTHTLKQH